MSRWLISVPVWGERCANVFCAAALPALERAMLALDSEVYLVLHTDQFKRIAAAATQVAGKPKIKLEARALPVGAREFDCMSQAHREVLQLAFNEDRVMLLTADMVVSEGALQACDKALANPQKLLVTCCAMRAVEEGALPTTKSPRKLLAWAWANRHSLTDLCRWPDGRSSDLSRMYFERGGNVVARLALPHPLALRRDKRVLCFAPTIDTNLMQCFQPSEIHMVASPDELAVVELSPRDKTTDRVSDMTMRDRFWKGEFKLPDPLQQWCYGHKVVLCGNAEDCGDNQLARSIIKGV